MILFVFCSTCMYKIKNIMDSTICETEGCLYKIRSKTSCDNILDNLNYYKYCVKVSKALHTIDEFERIHNPEIMLIVYQLLRKLAMKKM